VAQTFTRDWCFNLAVSQDSSGYLCARPRDDQRITGRKAFATVCRNGHGRARTPAPTGAAYFRVAVKPLVEKYRLEAELDPSGLLGPPEAVAPSSAGLRGSMNLFAETPFAMESVLTVPCVQQ